MKAPGIIDTTPPKPVPRKRNSHVWLGADIRELVDKVAKSDNRTLSGYIYHCVLMDLYRRGLVDYKGDPVAPLNEQKELVNA